jgi:hypothetical protein
MLSRGQHGRELTREALALLVALNNERVLRSKVTYGVRSWRTLFCLRSLLLLTAVLRLKYLICKVRLMGSAHEGYLQ